MSIEDHGSYDRDWASLIRAYIGEELAGVNTSNLARIERFDRDTMRVDVALKADPGAIIDDVPVSTTYASSGVGDIPPLRPGDEGLVIFLDLPLDDGLLGHRGLMEQPAHRLHRVDDAVFLPSMVFYDSDDIPNHNHDAAERVIAHPDGPRLRMHEGRVELSHGDTETADTGHGTGGLADAPPRVRLRLTDDPYYDERNAAYDTAPDHATTAAWTSDTATDVSAHPPDATLDTEQVWPRGYEHAALLEHPSATTIAVTEQGVGVVPGNAPTGERRGLYAGALTDPERVRVRGHRHEVRGLAQPVTDEGVTVSGDGTETVTIPHTLGVVPGHVDVTPRTEDAAADFWVAEKTAADVTIEYAGDRPTGTDNLVYDVFAHPPSGTTADVYVTTPPLSRREETDRLANAPETVVNTDEASGDMTLAATRAENHAAYIRYVSGQPNLDPGDPVSWPTVEHVPETAEWHAWNDPAYDPMTYTPPADAEPVGVDIDADPDLDT